MEWTPWEKVPGVEFTDLIYEKKYRKIEGQLAGGVARISVNRPDRMNAFTQHTMDEGMEATLMASDDPTVGIIIHTGVGDNFGSGGDVEWEAGGGLVYLMRVGGHGFNEYAHRSRKPVLAVVRGYCLGGSHHWAYCCDFTIAADNAIFGQNGPRVGSPADGWPMAYLTRVVGAKKAREIWMLCRRYTAQEALQMGLVNEVWPLDQLDDAVDRFCSDLLDGSPACIEILKASFDMDIDYMRGSNCSNLNSMYPEYFSTEESKEGQKAFMEKRPPNFWQYRKPKE